MTQVVYKIAGYTFSTKEEYQAAVRDARKILSLQVKDTDDFRTARKLSRLIARNHIFFESPIGQKFLEKIDNCIKEYRRKLFRKILTVVCKAVLAGGVIFLSIEGIQEYRSRRSMNTLLSRVEKMADQQEEILQDTLTEAATDWYNEKTMAQETDQHKETGTILLSEILPEYRELYEENSDLKGWLTVEGTNLQYPVMQGPDNEYYLSHNFQKEYDKNGLLVMDVRCTEEAASPQYIVYGHNVQSGRMFGELLNYKEEAYYKFHPSIQFDFLSEEGTYNIVAVFRTSMNGGIPFYQYTGFTSQEEFQEYITQVKEISLYDCGVLPEYGEPLLALVTCEYTEEDGRFVVLAVKAE